MKTFFKFLFSILLFLLFSKALGYSLYAMNLPSDLFAPAGVFGVGQDQQEVKPYEFGSFSYHTV